MEERVAALAEWKMGTAAIHNRLPEGTSNIGNEEGFWFDWIIARLLLRKIDPLIEFGE